MSLTVLGIAALHAVPIVVAAAISQSKGPITLAALIVGGIGATSGSPQYMVMGFIGVGLG